MKANCANGAGPDLCILPYNDQFHRAIDCPTNPRENRALFPGENQMTDYRNLIDGEMVDKIDVKACTEFGIPLLFTPGVNHT